MAEIKNICILIPAYNESGNIGDIIDRVRIELPGVIIVVSDDGSTDGTALVAKQRDAVCLQSPVNRGKGDALLRGFRYAAENGFSWMITMDADGQHDPAELTAFIECAGNGKYDLITGCRKRDPRVMPLQRIASNGLTSLLVSLRTGQKMCDSQIGYRMIRTSLTKRLNLTCRLFDLETEILLKTGLAGYSIGQVPVKTIYGAGRSSIRGLRDTVKFITLFVKSFFWTKKDLYVQR